MSEHCPLDGGFVGEAGCTHPNHQHSELVKRIVGCGSPTTISSVEARNALREGFIIHDGEGIAVGFGRRLLSHLEYHSGMDAEARLMRLEFAVSTVASPDKIEHIHRGNQNRTAYAKAFKDFGILVISDDTTKSIREVFTLIPSRKEKRR